jgi:hypothetical protein
MSLDLQAPPPAEVPTVPSAPSTTRKTRKPRLIVVLTGIVLAGALAFGAVQTVALSGVNEDLTASQGTVSDLRDDVSGLEGDLDLARGSIDSLESDVAVQDAQLASCAKANHFSLKADQAWHDAVGQIMPAAFGGSSYGFDSALAEYRSYSQQWADAANACEGRDKYTFGKV